MQIKIIKYKDSDFNTIKEGIEGLTEHIIKVDPLKRQRMLPTYSKNYTKNLISKVKKNKGIILIAYEGKNVAGFIAGYIEKQPKENLLECVPTKAGKVEDLFVYPAYRSKNIGKLLMNKIENYFKNKGCDVIRLNVFTPNTRAHEFYKKLNYLDRAIDMLKIIR